ncbi:MAG: glutamate synthase subunit alpha, partial [Thermoleophilia bacterium]|nr:glutamate synthase subunit alpha [Thermoleophilia bacterium]
MSSQFGLPPKQGLYDPQMEHDSCGVGFIAHIKGQRSHDLLLDAAHMLTRMNHRGACGCEENTGDGAGIMTALPHDFLAKVAKDELGVELPEPGRFGAGLVYLPTKADERERCKATFNRLIVEQGQNLVGWREVPADPDGADIGPTARASMPNIEMVIISAGDDLKGDAFERQLYLIQKRA